MALHALPTQSVLSASRADAPRFDACATPASLAQVLDRYFGNVCELDLIFNFHKAYYILDELLIAGEQQETSKKAVIMIAQVPRAIICMCRGAAAASHHNWVCVQCLLTCALNARAPAHGARMPHAEALPRPRTLVHAHMPTKQVLKLITEQDAVCEEGTDKDMQ